MEMNLFSFRINEMKFIIIIIIIYSQRTAKHTIHKINIHTQWHIDRSKVIQNEETIMICKKFIWLEPEMWDTDLWEDNFA